CIQALHSRLTQCFPTRRSSDLLEQVHLAAAPDAAIAVLVRDQILEDRHARLAVRVSGIFEARMRAARDTEGVVGRDVPVEHESVDPKSTRLNSSHVKISYAVFC